LKHAPPADLRRKAKANKIASYFLPGRTSIGSADIRQVVEPSQDGMSTPKPEHYPCQPTGNQPGGYKAVRVHRYRGAMKTLLSHLPELQDQEQSPYHGIHGVLMVWDQLGRQERKGALPFIAEKAGNRHALFPELREQVNSVPPVGADLSVATLLSTDRTDRSKER